MRIRAEYPDCIDVWEIREARKALSVKVRLCVSEDKLVLKSEMKDKSERTNETEILIDLNLWEWENSPSNLDDFFEEAAERCGLQHFYLDGEQFF